MRRVAVCVGIALALAGVPSRAVGQVFDLGTERDSAHVGDTVTYHARVSMGKQGSFADPVPKVVGEVPAGFRLLRADTLRKVADGGWEGDVVVMFLRLGRQGLPPIAVVARRIGADRGNPLLADAESLEVTRVAPPADAPLQPIRWRPAARLGPLVAGAVALLAAAFVAWRWRRARDTAARRPA
ncbi:MAG: hypothetical protein NW201_01585, partial [Gemmatimonadales bacterium]|nr:hypothetical protein [Gemmatimonadales bacterium]